MASKRSAGSKKSLPVPSIHEIYGVVAFVISPNYPDAVHPNDDLGSDWHMNATAKRALANPLNDEFVRNVHHKLDGRTLLTDAQSLTPDITGGCTVVFDVVERISDQYDT